jgi:hypothetical protein
MAENIYLRDLLQRAQTELKIKEDELKQVKKSTDMKRSSASNHFALFSSSSTLLSSIPSDSAAATATANSHSPTTSASPSPSSHYSQQADVQSNHQRNNINAPSSTASSTSSSRVVF